jgi:hypothetical protein
VVFAIEIGLIDGEGIDQMLDFVIGIGPEQGKIRLE